MEQNKIRTYLLYAIGEIALVMIGILLALQVNNWNEERKLDNVEQQILKDIRENLVASREDLIFGKDLNEMTNRNNKIIIIAIEKDLALTDSIRKALNTLTNWHSPFFTYTAYESLKSKGLDIIKDQELKKQIIKMYEREFEFLINDYDKGEWNFMYTKNEMVVRHLKFNPEPGLNQKAYPTDFEALKSDTQFENMLSLMIRQRSLGIEKYANVITMLDDLILNIEQEIE